MSTKAKESLQIRRARKKIKQQLDESEKQTNEEALHKMSKIIQRQLARRSVDRIDLRTKTITLFDENQHPAKTESKFINRLMSQLKQKYHKEASLKPLEGRIKINS